MPREARGKSGKPSQQRLKPRRPRDELGRPQEWGAPDTLELADLDSNTLEENHRLGIGYLSAGKVFHAHEAWETAWKQARDSGDAELFKGLSQMGAGYTHLLRGNAHGAMKLLRRAAGRIGAYPAGHRGIDTAALAERCEADAAAVESGDLVPGPGALRDPPRL